MLKECTRGGRKLKAYLGLLNYYGKFLKNFFVTILPTIEQFIKDWTKLGVVQLRLYAFAWFSTRIHIVYSAAN